MKILKYTIQGSPTHGNLTAADKLYIESSCLNIRGVKKIDCCEVEPNLFILTLSLSLIHDENAIDENVKKLGDGFGLIIQNGGTDVEFDPLLTKLSHDLEKNDTEQDEEFDDEYEQNVFDEPYEPVWEDLNTSQLSEKKKANRQVSLTSAVSAVITAVVLAVLLTFSVTRAYMRSDSPVAVTPGQGTVETSDFDQLEILDRLFRSASVLEAPDREALITSVLKAYVEATGDVYAEYLTEEELQEQLASNNGEMCGIGITVTQGYLIIDGVDYVVITVANVYPDSPAEAAGVQPGDHIMYVGKGDDAVLVQDVGYTKALDLLAGEENTECNFTVYRFLRGADEEGGCEALEITAIRKKLTVRTVTFSHYTEDASVGVIRMTGFNNTTYDQFVEAVETLKAEGCTSFVLDLRGNPGGLLTAVEDVLILFLRENDTIITTKDAAGKETVTKVVVGAEGVLMTGSGQLTVEDVGKYRDLNFSVLVNEYSASAAELFTSNIRDYGLGTIVGMTTYGKGCGQTTMRLSRYGYGGALKLTTFYYCAPLGENYHDVGITPHVVVDLSEEALQYNINVLPHHLDNQLAAAVAALE